MEMESWTVLRHSGVPYRAAVSPFCESFK
uniref:Uncharacterized protein n=1 Tax=Anopheles quadriannulatus TaxID=34691 RepID=A0A182XTX8_ANOQN